MVEVEIHEVNTQDRRLIIIRHPNSTPIMMSEDQLQGVIEDNCKTMEFLIKNKKDVLNIFATVVEALGKEITS